MRARGLVMTTSEPLEDVSDKDFANFLDWAEKHLVRGVNREKDAPAEEWRVRPRVDGVGTALIATAELVEGPGGMFFRRDAKIRADWLEAWTFAVLGIVKP